MDEASKLVLELQQKLSELDLKVWKYRRDMAAEFEKYAEGLLRDVPKDVSETVSKTMAEAIKSCTSLYPPGSASSIESCAPGTSIENDIGSGASSQPHVSPIPAPLRKQQEEMESSPRSPHARDLEFQGVFTPSYLPLLDSTSRNERRSSYDHPTSPPPLDFKQQETEPLLVDASTDTQSLVTSPEASRPATPRRRNTDEASVASDHSEGTIRRSALRRSSSASNKDRASPRRVRFDVAGEEVLPTSSPQPVSATPTENQTSLFDDDGDDEAESEQIEDVENPPPKRISSSQALRALSRSPLVDDGTQWTTVTAPPDGSASVATANGISQDSSSEDLYMGNGVSRLGQRELSGPANGNRASVETTENNPASDAATNDDLDTLSDDEDMLDMPPLRRQSASPASMLSPANPPNLDEIKSPTASTRPNKAWQGMDNFGLGGGDVTMDELKFDKGDDDDLFHFDENLGRRSPPLETESPPEGSQDEERDSFDTESPTYRGEARDVPTGYASSPARPIVRPRQSHSEAPSSTGVVGSYKGHPFSMPVVSPEVHAQGASMGPLDSFVGSVDGRSGMDASNVQSYRASGGVGSFSGTPRSMSERLMMEEVMKAQQDARRR